MTTILKTLLEITLFSSIMIITVMAIKAICSRKINSKIISFLWILVLVRLIIPITIESPVHVDSFFPEKPVQEAFVKQAETPVEYTGNGAVTEPYVATNTSNVSTNTKSQAEPATPLFFEKVFDYMKSISIWTYVFIAWSIGALVIFSKKTLGYICFNKRVMGGSRLSNPFLSKTLRDSKMQLGIDKSIRILTCKYISTPVTFGCFNPVILLPVDLTNKLSDSKLRMIVLHELCHIKRRNVLKSYFWLIAKTIHWFNLLVWIAYKNYLDDVELACDEMVLKHISEDDSFEYSQSLLDVIRLSKGGMKTSIALSFCEK